MKRKSKYIVIFLCVFLGVTILGLVGFKWLEGYYNSTSYEEFDGVDESEKTDQNSEEKELDATYGQNKRVNVLMAGLEGERTDTLMVFSYNQQDNRLDIISVPRDTYVDYGFKGQGQNKINSVYGYPGSKGGIQSTAAAVSKVLGVPIDEYVAIDYEGVKKVIDSLGGIDVDIPFRMKYDDPYDDPPLHINFQPGPKTLNGKQAVEYLRWRKNNYGNGGDGDIGRIKRQQDFVMKVINKSLNPTVFPEVVKVGLENTKTSMDFKQALYYAGKAVSMDRSKIYPHTIEGKDEMIDGLWHFIHDPVQTRQLMKDIYEGVVPTQQTEESDKQTKP